MGRTDQITAAEHYMRGPSNEVPESVRIWLLGGFRTSVGHKEATEESQWRLRKAAKLVKLLALAPNHRMHRERAMDLLRLNLDLKVSNNLRHVLHVARWALGLSGATVSPRSLLL